MGIRILIVEDDAAAGDGLAELVGLWGYETAVAPTGAQALVAAGELHPAVALIDIGLPDMSGVELARRMRAAGGARVALVALTGSPEDACGVAERSPFDHYLQKPIDIDVLEQLLARAAANQSPL